MKECPSCTTVKPLGAFKDSKLVKGFGRICNECKGKSENKAAIVEVPQRGAKPKEPINLAVRPDGDEWNQKRHKEFSRLRGQLQAAKREKNYKKVLSTGTKIIELGKKSKFIIAAFALKDLGNACIQLGDHAAAVKYLVAAKADFIEYGKKINEPEYWKANIEVIERKIKKLRGN